MISSSFTEVPERANRLLMESMEGSSKFVTFFYGALEPDTREAVRLWQEIAHAHALAYDDTGFRDAIERALAQSADDAERAELLGEAAFQCAIRWQKEADDIMNRRTAAGFVAWPTAVLSVVGIGAGVYFVASSEQSPPWSMTKDAPPATTPPTTTNSD